MHEELSVSVGLLVGNIAVISVIFDNQTKFNESWDNRCKSRILQAKLEKSTIMVLGIITHETTVLNNAGGILLLIRLNQLHTFLFNIPI